MHLQFVSNRLEPGLWVQVRGTRFVSREIQKGLAKMHKRHCEKYGLEYKPPWGNHTAQIGRNFKGQWGIGEALPSGNQFTPIEKYNELLRKGIIEVRVYRVIGASRGDQRQAWCTWWRRIKGLIYNFGAYFRLFCKSYIMDWSDSKYAWMRRIGDKAAGWKFAKWCTQGINDSWRWRPVKRDVCQSKNAIPSHVEQSAGELAYREDVRTKTLENITKHVTVTVP